MSERIELKLYVSGESIRSKRAIQQLRSLMEERFKGNYDISIIDILKSPQTAEEDRILVVPTVIKKVPPPQQRIIGSLADQERVIHALDLATP